MNQDSSQVMAAKPAPTNLRARLKLAVRETLLEAAERSVIEDGLEGANLQAIAKRAGVAVGTIYNYFEDRQQLFDELFEVRRAELFESVAQMMKANARAPAKTQLTALTDVVLGYYDRRRAFCRAALPTELRARMMTDRAGRFRPGTTHLEAAAARVMRAGVHEGLLRPDGAELYAPMFVGMLHAVLLSRLHDERPLVLEGPQVLRLFLRGAAK